MSTSKVTVKEPFTLTGKRHIEVGKVVEVPAEAVDKLELRGLIVPKKPAAVPTPSTVPKTADEKAKAKADEDAAAAAAAEKEAAAKAKADAETGEQTGRALWALEVLGDAVVDGLIAAGYESYASINAATDDELKSVPGIGDATIKKIREIVTSDTATPSTLETQEE